MKRIIYISILILAACNSKAQTTGKDSIKLIDFTVNEKMINDLLTGLLMALLPPIILKYSAALMGKLLKPLPSYWGPDPEQHGDRYQYVEKVKEKNTTVYYRLRHIDDNGKEQVTEIITPTK